MRRRRFLQQALSAPLVLPLLRAQDEPVVWVCPMDPDVRGNGPGKCTKCGMALEPDIREQIEYPVKLQVTPAGFRPGQKVQLAFQVLDPVKGQPVTRFREVHERLFHLFLISQDLEFFVHDHPQLGPDSIFRYETSLPKPGQYRLLCDFYPEGGTPQLVPETVIAPGQGPRANLVPDRSPKHGSNLDVELVTEPPQPIAGQKTLLFFRLNPAEGLEPYLGVWGHLLAASEDLVDLMHEHPAIADGGPQVQFNLIFPRPGLYRIWVQFQRLGKVNTAVFTVPVLELK